MQADMASIAKFIMNKCERDFNAVAYFENIKEGFRLPAIYFPIPRVNVYKSSVFKDYVYENTMFIQIFAMTNDSSFAIANAIARLILQNNGYIPILQERGVATSDALHARVVSVSRIEDSVSQVQLTWNCFCDFSENNEEKIREVKYNLKIGE